MRNLREAISLFERLNSNDMKTALKSLEDIKYVLLSMDRKYPEVTKKVMQSMKDIYILEKSLKSLMGTVIHTKSLKSYNESKSDRLYLDPKYVRSLPTWKSLAGTAILPDGRKIREFHDSTESDKSKATWYKVVKTRPKRTRAGDYFTSTRIYD